MHYSGILVRSIPPNFDTCAAAVDACEGVEVFLRYPDASCLVAVIESDEISGQETGLRAIQDLSSVASADLVYHRADDSTDPQEMAVCIP